MEVTIVARHQIVPRRSMKIGVRSLPLLRQSKVGINIELDWLMLVTVFEQRPQNNGIISKISDPVTPVLIIPYFR